MWQHRLLLFKPSKNRHSKIHCTRNLLSQWNNPMQQRESSAEFLYTPRLLPMSKMRHIHRGKALIANHMMILWCQCSTVLMLILTSLLWISIGTDVIYTVLDADNLPFSIVMPHRFSAGSHAAICRRPRGNTRIASAAMRGSSVQQCADRPRICTIARGWTPKRMYLTEDGYRLLNPCSHATAEALSNGQTFCHTHPRYFFYTYVYL